MKIFNKTLIAAATALVCASAAQAGEVSLPGGLFQLSDNNAEYLINANGGTDTILDQGDRLRGIFDINSIEGISPALAAVYTPFNGYELVGIFDITVASKTGSAATGFSYTFTSSNALSTTGAAAEMYIDTALNYTRLGCATTAACEATVTDGDLWAAFGFGSTSFWSATSITDDISVIGNINPPGVGGTFNLGLDFLVNNTGYTFLTYECLFKGSGLTNSVCGSGSLLGTAGVDTPFDSFSNVDFVLNRVPEPASLALLGIGLLGLGFSRRRKV